MDIENLDPAEISHVRSSQPPSFDIDPLLLRRNYNGPAIGSLTRKMRPLLREPSIIIAVGEAGFPPAYALAGRLHQGIVRVRIPKRLKGKNVVTDRYTGSDAHSEAGLNVDLLKQAIADVRDARSNLEFAANAESDREIPVLVIDNALVTGLSMAGTLALLRGEKLREAIDGVRLRVDGLGFFAIQRQGREFIEREFGIPRENIKGVLNYGRGMVGRPLEHEDKRAYRSLPKSSGVSGERDSAHLPRYYRLQAVRPYTL